MGFLRYVPKYSVRDMADFLRNEKRSPASCEADLAGKTTVITGATSGIGLETARLFASRGASLVCCNRNADKSRALEEELRDRHGTEVRTLLTDFSSLARTRECAEALLALKEPIDILIHNAGVYHTRRTFTPDGIEAVFQVIHLASFYLNRILLDRLKKEDRARIVYVNSEGHRFALGGVHLDDLGWKRHVYTGLASYGAAKTAQLLTMARFVELLGGSRVTINAMHPGNVKSHLGENNGRLYRWMKKTFILSSARDPSISAQALLHLAAAEELDGVTGQFFNLTTPEKPAPHALDPTLIEPVWLKSLELCDLA
ncbi:MAG: SDR family NAD(P)-dependent oxidoreductase [Deltaproteobacteria bacterium]|nr:SDR family NAD(P)-dependent oxidoreductase [Deltaproteobacteria bacterium]